MRPTQIFTATIFLLLASEVAAKPVKQANSEVTEAVIFSSGALVTREAKLSIGSGDTTVRVAGLPHNVSEDSIRVEVSNSDVRIGQVLLALEQLKDDSDYGLMALEQKLKETENSLGELDDRIQAAKLQLGFLESISNGFAKDSWTAAARGTADANAWSGAANTIGRISTQALRDIRITSVQKADVQKEIDLLKRQIRDTRGGGNSRKFLEVGLNSKFAVQSTLKIHYLQTDAEWKPVYEARLNSDTGDLVLNQLALVSQETGEDWRGVKVTLSTNSPEEELVAPELYSQYLDLYEDLPASRSGSFKSKGVRLEEVIVTAQKRSEPTVSAYSVNYTIPGYVSIANDGDEQQVFELDTFTFTASLVTRIVPRESQNAFLTANIVFDKSTPLGASEMNTYVDGVYVGKTEMPGALPNEKVSLPMGLDRRVDFSLIDLGGENSTVGIIGKQAIERVDVQFDITNRRRSVTMVEVLDLYPIPRNRKVKVTVPDSATIPTENEVENKPGVIAWRKSLQSGDKWQIHHGYTVRYPAAAELSTD